MKTISKQTLRSLLLVAVAATTFSANVSAQSYDNYNKRELLLQVLDQSRPNDYVPVFFNIHFPDKFGYKAVKSHIDWFRSTHVDFVNVKYEYVPDQVEIKSPAVWKKIKQVTPEQWVEQIQVVHELARELKNEAFIIPTYILLWLCSIRPQAPGLPAILKQPSSSCLRLSRRILRP